MKEEVKEGEVGDISWLRGIAKSGSGTRAIIARRDCHLGDAHLSKSTHSHLSLAGHSLAQELLLLQ